MNDKFNKIIEGIKSIHLSSMERDRIWHNIDAYVANNPVDETPVIRRVKHGVLSPFFFHTQRVAAFSLVALIVLGGGTSLAAKDALPNDTLYNIKVNVNEEVRAWFSFGAESKAYYETKRAGERLEEAQKLAVMGKLDTQAKETIQTNLKKHSESVQKQIATIEASNDLNVAIDVSENFENSLKAHSKSLMKIEKDQKISVAVAVAVSVSEPVPVDAKIETATFLAKEPVSTLDVVPALDESISEIGQIVNTVQENIDVSVHAREEVEAKIPVLADSDTKKIAAESKREDAVVQIEKVKVVLDKNPDKISVASTTLASTTLNRAVGLVAEGDKTFNAKEYGGAFTLFKNGFDTAVRAEMVLSTSTIETRVSIPLNTN